MNRQRGSFLILLPCDMSLSSYIKYNKIHLHFFNISLWKHNRTFIYTLKLIKTNKCKDIPVKFPHSSQTNNNKMQVLNGNMGELLHHRRCIISPAWRRQWENKTGAGQEDSMSIARNGRCVSQLLLRSTSRLLQ